MGITKLLHIKERKTGNAARGLLNAIYYILNPEKTQNKRLVGGNCGRDEEMIYRKFMDTKSAFEKLDGRQGYHFMISFSPEENVSTSTCMNVMSDFMDEYLKNEYDAVFAVHDDQEHMHGHLVFNSVNSITGKKYRYEDGDWEKYIQPITDRIAERYGLSKLEFVRADEELDIDWNEKIKNDIKECIQKSEDYEDFKKKMQTEYQYNIREGYSKKHGLYLSYKPQGKRKAVRSYQLPKYCQPYNISRRIALSKYSIFLMPAPVVRTYYYSNTFYQKNAKRYLRWNEMSMYQKAFARQVYKAHKLYKRTNSNRPWENQRIITGINHKMKQLQFLQHHNISTIEEVNTLKQDYSDRLRNLNKEIGKTKRKYADFTDGQPSIFDMYEEMLTLKRKKVLTTEEAEKINESEELLEQNYVGEVYQEYQEELGKLYFEKDKIKKEMRLIRGVSSDLVYFRKKEQAQKEDKELLKKEKKNLSAQKSNQK